MNRNNLSVLLLIILVILSGCLLGGTSSKTSTDSFVVGAEETSEKIYLYVQPNESIPAGSNITLSYSELDENITVNLTYRTSKELEEGVRYYTSSTDSRFFVDDRSLAPGTDKIPQRDVRGKYTFIIETGNKTYKDSVIVTR